MAEVLEADIVDIEASRALLGFACDMLSDLESMRIANANRFQALTADEEKFGKGYPESTMAYIELHGMAILDDLIAAEKRAIKILNQALKTHPLYDWIKATPGVGEKTAGRFIAEVGGDPYWHSAQDRPRTLGELYAYCGLHVVDGQAARNKRGQQSNWNNQARVRVYLMAEAQVKNKNSAYRHVYDAGREKYKDLDMRDAQKHARAIRLVMKALVKAMWQESARWHREHD